MFFDPAEGMRPAPLKFSPFKALVVPRPIGWITSMDSKGNVNLAPYSYFNAVSEDPPCVMFCPNDYDGGRAKDTRLNIEETGEFVCNMVSWDQREEMSATAGPLPRGVNEMTHAKLAAEPSVKIRPPRVRGAPAHLECKYLQTISLPQGKGKYQSFIVIGQVVGINICDDVIIDGRVDILKFKPVARLGYKDYTVVDSQFTMVWPD
jgi:flavin reductase (DIM6/NTAB) family NADH-FMN oxidoreductase RutF